MANSEQQSTTNGETVFSLCTFCNNSTNGFEKRLFATEQPKGPFFPILAELQESKTKLDLLGRAIVCVACFHHLLRQWSSFERRGIPVRKREYNIIAGMGLIRVIIHVEIAVVLTENIVYLKEIGGEITVFHYLCVYNHRFLSTGYLCLFPITETPQ